MDALAAERLVGAQHVFARNVMVIVVPANSSKVTLTSDLANHGIRLVLAGSKVPAGHYAEQILAKMTPGVEPNFAKKVLANVVSRETDVKAVLAKVALGEADAGFVFATDAVAAGPRVRTISIRPAYNVIGEYPIAALTSTRNPMGAASFINFVLSPDGQSILRAHGFMSPPAGKP
jgi:molybdate transport system substrate-binding protein